jgi:hypothetical protein
MHMRRFATIGLLVAGLAALGAPAQAADVEGIAPARAAGMVLACQNGANYPIQPIAVSREGDLVTGYMLRTGTGRAIRLRLVPMGNGYRYEGGGIWFDGVRNHAVLNWDRPNAVPCEVVQEP